MKKRFTSLFLALALLSVPATIPASAAPAASEAQVVSTEAPVVRDPAAEIAPSDNAGRGGYQTCGRRLFSYLYQRGDGNITRMALFGREVIEVYDRNFQLLASTKFPGEKGFTLGGFFHGEHYNFAVYGKDNPSQSDSQEVVRVVKYSLNWERLGQASLLGANTTRPFHSGSLRCAEYNGVLYIRTCHEMYRSEDGKNHQASMMLAVRQSDMEIIDARYSIGGGGGYTSHSFNQFVITNENGMMATLDHCDSYPRAAVLQLFDLNASGGRLDTCASVNLQEFPGQRGVNNTYASIGGLGESSTHYLAVGNLGAAGRESRDVYLYAVDKSSFQGYGAASVKSVKLAGSADKVGTTSTPQLVKITDDRFLVLWNVIKWQSKYFMYVNDGTLAYTFVDGRGNQIGEVHAVKGFVSDCQPIVIDGKAVWYSGAVLCSYEHDPTFYTIDGATGAFTSTVAKNGAGA